MGLKIIITGATGFVGEGVMMTCLEHPEVDHVLIVNRKNYPKKHPKLSEIIVPDFFKIEEYIEQLTGYDACFFCAGVSSLGMKEKEYTRITYDLTLHFAGTVSKLNPGMVFTYVSGAMTDSTENGRVMWARIKGRTENDLLKLPFKGEYNFRPGLMKPVDGQVNVKGIFKLSGILYPVLRLLTPKMACTVQDVGLAMINCVLNGYPKPVLEVEDIKKAAGGNAPV